MNEFDEKNIDDINEQSQESVEASIFQEPAQHKRSKFAGKNGRIISAIALVLVLALLLSLVITYDKKNNKILGIKLPDAKDKNSNSAVQNSTPAIPVVNVDNDKISVVNLTNENGSFNFYWKISDDSQNQEKLWCVEGIDPSLTSSAAIEYVASNTAAISAKRVIEGRSKENCGFDKPQAKIEVIMEQGYDNYTITIGAASADKTGTYLMVSGDDNIYLVSNDYAQYFKFNRLDLADTTNIEAVQYDSSIATYFDDDKRLETFDTITVYGTALSRNIVITPNKNTDLGAIIPFMISSPYVRYADNIDALVSSFITGISVVGAYSYDLSAEEIKKVGLDNPDVIISARVGSKTKTYKFSIIDDKYCAIVDETKKMIKKVSISAVPFVKYEEKDYYSNWLCMEMLTQISSIDIKIDQKDYNFNISYDETAEENSKRFTILKGNGEYISTSLYQSFYQSFLGTKITDFSVKDISASPDMVIKLVYSSDFSENVYAFYKVSDTKYQYSINGVMQGKITATSYNKIVQNVKLVYENKEIIP